MPDLPPAAAPVSPSGPYRVVTADAVLDRAPASRAVPVTIHAPAGLPRAPLAVISHGTGGDRHGYRYLGLDLASHGWVVVHPNHARSDSRLLASTRYSENRAAIIAASNDPDEWRQRPADVVTVMDRAHEIQALIGCEINERRTAVVGHSLGALTAMALAGAEIRLPEGRARLRDPRIVCVAALSPYGEGSAFDAGSWSGLEGPVLYLTGDLDTGIQGEPTAWRTEPFARLPPGNKWMAVMPEATHLAFTDPLPFNDIPTVRRKTREWVRAFLATFHTGGMPEAAWRRMVQECPASDARWYER